MSVHIVNNEIARFLKSGDPEVVCIRGKWGVGKTYAWRAQIEEARNAKHISLPRYSYVSLFGVSSLEALKFAIFENVITLGSGTLQPNLNTLDNFITSNLGSWRRLTRIAQSLPILRSFTGGEVPAVLSFLTIREQIICFDDLERRGKGLDIGDVLGLASLLREQRGCKVALILNDEELSGDEKERFQSYLEKVVDVSLVYAPTASESVSIAVPGDNQVSRRVSELCTSLGISNIRVIKKIERFCQLVQPLLTEYDEEVFSRVTNSLALFCWSHDQPGVAPTLEFLTTKKSAKIFMLKDEDSLTPEEASWNALLDSYGYSWTDEFDLALIESVRNGYFDPVEVEKHAKALDRQVVAMKADGSFEEAWSAYHDSFEDNEDEVLDGIYESYMRNFKHVSPINLNGTVRLFKDLGRENQALQMIEHYIDNQDEDSSIYNLDSYPFGGDVTDPDIREAFKGKCATLKEVRDTREMLLSLKNTWTDELLSALANTPAEEYRLAFKETTGDDLRRMLAGVLQFDRIVNASPEMVEITKRAKEALKLIGAECRLNARRVARLGITIEKEVPPTSEVPEETEG